MSLPYWRLSGFYFCYFATLGSFLPFWSLYLKHAGFGADQIGELTALLIATKIVVPNLWGWLADKTGKRLRLIRLTSLLSAILFAGFLFRADYGWFAAVTLAFSSFWNATLPLFEAATLFHLKKEPQRYSRIRLWGSVGFIAAVLGIGRILDGFSIGYLPNVILGLLVANWLLALTTPEALGNRNGLETSSIWRVLGRGEVIAFFAVYMLLQVAHGPYYTFYSVYLQSHGYSATATGMLWALGVCAEILMFLVVTRFLRCFSVRSLLLGSLALSMLRWLLIAYRVDSMPVLLAAQCLHAATFGVAHVVAIHLLHQYFGDSHQGKGQGFYSSLSFGLGGMLGSLYSGYFWDSLGPREVYVIAALASGLALLIAYLGVAKRKERIAI